MLNGHTSSKVRWLDRANYRRACKQIEGMLVDCDWALAGLEATRDLEYQVLANLEHRMRALEAQSSHNVINVAAE
jgi:uncharacterized membrane protein